MYNTRFSALHTSRFIFLSLSLLACSSTFIKIYIIFFFCALWTNYGHFTPQDKIDEVKKQKKEENGDGEVEEEEIDEEAENEEEEEIDGNEDEGTKGLYLEKLLKCKKY